MNPTHKQTEGDEEWLLEALQRYATYRERDLRDAIAERTSWLATRGARRFADCGEPFDDLVQVARIGLLNAIDRFDPFQGVPFGAYATPTIMGELRRYFRDHTWGVHVSRRAKDLRPAVNAASEALSKELQRSPRVSETGCPCATAPAPGSLLRPRQPRREGSLAIGPHRVPVWGGWPATARTSS